MIEVEKKFILTEEQASSLLSGAEFLKEEKLRDIYFDDENYSLTSRDLWLRNRNGKFELKVPIIEDVSLVNKYSELESDDEIRNYLHILGKKPLKEEFRNLGIVPFLDYIDIRKKYKKEGFSLDLDVADFESFIYKICEIELLVENKNDIDLAEQKILDFAKRQGLVIDSVRGKVIEFLRREKKDHYRALISAGVVKDYSFS